MKKTGLFPFLERFLGTDRWYYSYTLANMAAGGISILIPLYVLHLGGAVDDIGLLTALGNLVGIIASLTWGRLSDRWNSRKYFVVLGFLGVGGSFVLMALTRSFRWLVLLNCSYLLFWMSAASVGTILIIEKADRSQWDDKIGSFNFNAGLGWVLGLGIGLGWSALSGNVVPEGAAFRYMFGVMGLFSLLGALLAVKFIPEEVKFERAAFRGRLVEAGDLITERFRYLPIHLYYFLKPVKVFSVVDKLGFQLSWFLVAVSLVFSGFAIFFIPLPAYFKNSAGLGEGFIYLLFILNSLFSTVFYHYAADFIRRRGAFKVLPVALGVRMALFPLIILPFSLFDGFVLRFFITGAMFVAIGVSWAFINVSNLVVVSKLTRGQIRGQVFGIYNGVSGASLVLGSLVGGYMAKYVGYLAAFLMASMFVAFGLMIIRNIARKKPSG